MALQLSNNQAGVLALNRGLSDRSPNYDAYNNMLAAAQENGLDGFALQWGSGYSGRSEDLMSTVLLTNLGLLPNAGLQSALRDYLVVVGKTNVGIVAVQLGSILSGLEGATGDQAIYAAAAARWNSELAASHAYSSNPANGMGLIGNPYFNVGTGTTLTVTNGVDVLSGTLYDDVFLAPAPGLLGSPDILNGGGMADAGTCSWPRWAGVKPWRPSSMALKRSSSPQANPPSSVLPMQTTSGCCGGMGLRAQPRLQTSA